VTPRWYSLAATLAAAILVVINNISPVSALQPECIDDGQSEGFDAVYQKGVTKAEVTQQATSTWDDWIWKGEPYVCPAEVLECTYGFGSIRTTSTTISIGGLAQFGNRNSPSKSYMNAFLFLIPNYGKTVEYTTDFTKRIIFRPGDTAYPIQVATRRWRGGIYRGGYFKLDTTETCTAGGGSGHWYMQSNERPWGTWSDNVMENEWSTYVVNGYVGTPFK